MKEGALKQLYIKELRDAYDAEKQITKALPKMAKKATTSQLRQGFEEHLEQTKNHISRLEQIFEALDESPKGESCAGMEGLIEDGPGEAICVSRKERETPGVSRLRKRWLICSTDSRSSASPFVSSVMRPASKSVITSRQKFMVRRMRSRTRPASALSSSPSIC